MITFSLISNAIKQNRRGTPHNTKRNDKNYKTKKAKKEQQQRKEEKTC